MTVAERDADLMNRWRERQGSLANAELEDGQVDSGYRRNVVRLTRCISLARIPWRLSESFRRKQIYSVTSEVYRTVLCPIGSLLQKSPPTPHESSSSPHNFLMHQSRAVCVQTVPSYLSMKPLGLVSISTADTVGVIVANGCMQAGPIPQYSPDLQISPNLIPV